MYICPLTMKSGGSILITRDLRLIWSIVKTTRFTEYSFVRKTTAIIEMVSVTDTLTALP